jgi:hypothetical protein
LTNAVTCGALRHCAVFPPAALQRLDVKGLLAGGHVVHHAIGQAIQRVALLKHLVCHQLHVRRREGGLDVRIDRREGLDVPGMLHRCLGQVEAGVARDHAVKLVGISRSGHHRVAPAVGAPHHVGALRGLAVVRGDQLACHRREFAVGLVAVIQPCLRVHAKQVAAHQADFRRPFHGVASVAGEHGEALHQCVGGGAARDDIAKCGLHHAVIAAIGLQQEAAVPGRGHPHLETDGIGLAVGTCALVHAASDLAMRRHRIGLRHARDGGACRNRFSRGNAGTGGRKLDGQLCAVHGHGRDLFFRSRARGEQGCARAAGGEDDVSHGCSFQDNPVKPMCLTSGPHRK